MNKYKVCVYAICKNEEAFVKRWVSSMNEADEIYVLDTGSTDNTVKLLKENNVNVEIKEIKPWRFDSARNYSLNMLPKDTDICVCTDLDEVFIKGWRKKLEKIWNKNITKLGYNYNWRLDENNNPLVNFYIEKIHTRNNYIWTHPVHEILTCTTNENIVRTDDITLNHYPDNTKSRSSYLQLLKLSVKEKPEDDRNMHYLGREYMYYKKYNKAIDTLIKHLSLKSATWPDERCASMRFIARSYLHLGRIEEARLWANKAIKEAPYLRDPYMEKALIEYSVNNYKEIEKLINKALKIKEHPKTYINEIFSFGSLPYDLLSISNYRLGKYKESLKNIKKAIKIDPNNKRLIDNYNKIIKIIKQD